MKRIRLTYITFVLALLVQLGLGGSSAYAQNVEQKNHMDMEEMSAPVDTFLLAAKSDSLLKLSQPKVRFIPNSNRSVWLAMAFPGAGQIYNRKYWKLPIVYGGFVGCAYALNWNNKMYKDYSQAYLDIMDDDPNTKSYQDFLPLNSSIAGQEERFKEIFRKRKDVYRRQRDLSIFAFIGVYLLSIVDAYVDAELSDFDISNDIGLRVEPALFDNGHNKYNSVGLQCSLKF